MTDRHMLEETVNELLSPEFFLVETDITKDNDITVFIEKSIGDVQLDDCVKLSRALEERLDRDSEDYSLTVSSAGLDRPLKVFGQYIKYIGHEMDILLKKGNRFTAKILSADSESVNLEHTVSVAEEGKKRKVRKTIEERIPYSEIKSARPHITFR